MSHPFSLYFYKAGSIAILLLFTFTGTISFSQNRDNYNLLWKIEHKDGAKVSYLFGTMHLQDKRLFEFSDAVLPAIKNSESFALEIHPDSIYAAIADEMFTVKKENIYKRILTPSEYSRLDERFIRINGISLDSFSMNNPMMIETMLIEEPVKEDDKNTFVDVYLYGIADAYDKEINGLERVEDQLPLSENLSDSELRTSILEILDTSEEEYERTIEEMIQIYYEGDISRIHEYAMGLGAYDAIMTQRNKTMANSIKSITKHKTLFAAVGAAHLPGENGIIELLKKDGYKVTKVVGTFNNKQEDFKPVLNLKKWYKGEDLELGYSVLTPTRAENFKMEATFDVKTSIDMLSGASYAYFAIDMRGKELKENYDIIGNYIQYQTGGDSTNILEKRIVTIDSVPFTEVILKGKKKNFQRMQIGMSNHIVYGFFMDAKWDEIRSDYSNAFFNSIKLFPTKKINTIWKEYYDQPGSYSVELPKGNVRDVSREVANPLGEDIEPYKLNIFMGSDADEKVNYLLRYNDQPSGYYINDEGASYEEFLKYFKEKGTVIGEVKSMETEGIETREYEIMFGDSLHTIGRVFFRGNRTYFLLAQKYITEDKVDRDNPFFNSFKLKEYVPVAFDTVVTIDERYSFSFPKDYKTRISAEYSFDEYFDTTTTYYGRQVASGGVYLVEHTRLKAYAKILSLPEFYDEYIENLKECNDSIVSNTNIQIAGLPGREVLYSNPSTNVLQRIQFLLDDDNLFIIQGYYGKEEHEAEFSESFFESFKKGDGQQRFDRIQSKAYLIIKHLKSKDSIRFNNAFGALSYYEFEKEDVSLLSKQLSHSFKDDTMLEGAKNKIIAALAPLGNDKTLSEFKKMYLDRRTSAIQKLALIGAIPKVPSKNAITTYFDLLANHPPDRIKDIPYPVLDPLYDTTVVFAENANRIIPLLKTERYRDKLLSYVSDRTQYDSLDVSDFIKFKKDIVAHFEIDVTRYMDSISREKYEYCNYSLMYNYLEVINSLEVNPNDVVTGLDKLMSQLESDNWLQSKALITSLHIGAPVKEVVLKKALDSLYSRFEIMEALINSGNLKNVPEAYLETQEFARLCIYNDIGDYEGYPDFIDLAGIFTENEKDYFVFSYGFKDEENTARYMAVIEDIPVVLHDFKRNYGNFDRELLLEDWEAQARQLLKKYNEE